MYKDIFKQVGLSSNEAVVYDYLLKAGEKIAGEIIKDTPLKRGVIYNALSDLIEKGLVSERKIKKNKSEVSIFLLEHPQKLSDFIEKQEDKMQKAERNLSANMSKIVSDFNLISNKPGVRYFEGLEGVKKVLYDTLKTKSEIYTISDSKSIQEHAKSLNKDYVQKRKKLGIKKKLIVPISARGNYKETKNEFTEIRFLPGEYFNFDTGIQIYDGKISYQTIELNNMMGVLIEDRNIYNMHKMLFEYMWNTLSVGD